MELPVKNLSVAYSLADQSFNRTKSIGILNVSVGLVGALARRAEFEQLTVLSNRFMRDKFTVPAGVKVEEHDHAAGRGPGRVWWDQVGVYSAAKRIGHEWLFLPKGFASFSRKCPVRLATYVHDAMHDHYARHYPGATSPIESAYFRAAFWASVKESEIIFTPSQFTLGEITRLAGEKGLPVPRLVCCGEGFDRPSIPPATERRDIIVFASRFPHKLTGQAVTFLDRWCRENPFGEEIHWIGALPKTTELPSHPSWRRHSILPEKEFRTLLSRARVVLSFSDYEGFGRPPVEAAVAGACPVYSSIPTTREVMGDCGYSFDNGNYESFATALQSALKVDGEQLSAWSDVLSARHNWNAVADRVTTALADATINPRS